MMIAATTADMAGKDLELTIAEEMNTTVAQEVLSRPAQLLNHNKLAQ